MTCPIRPPFFRSPRTFPGPVGKVRQGGFSLIEVLVAVLLLSIGLLGLVALQARAITYSQDAVLRTQAVMLTDELAELLRANRGSILGATGLPATTSDYYKAKGTAFAAVPTSCSPLPAAATQRLACWGQRVGATLPGASDLLTSEFFVCRSNAPGVCSATGSAVAIQVAWRVKAGECLGAGTSAGSDNTICRYSMQTEL